MPTVVANLEAKTFVNCFTTIYPCCLCVSSWFRRHKETNLKGAACIVVVFELCVIDTPYALSLYLELCASETHHMCRSCKGCRPSFFCQPQLCIPAFFSQPEPCALATDACLPAAPVVRLGWAPALTTCGCRLKIGSYFGLMVYSRRFLRGYRFIPTAALQQLLAR
eukprot:1159281-Pelagomonas_calceolata.AAC.7